MLEASFPQGRIEDSLRKRYLYKLSIDFISFLLSLVTAGIVPRALGPTAYGNFSFLTAFFSQAVNFFDGGTSIGFYSKLSQRPREVGLIRFYWGFTGIATLGVLLFVTGIFIVRLETWLWPEQEARYIWMALVWGLLAWYSQIINKVVDAYGLTVPSEIARIRQKSLGVSLILTMLWLDRFSLAEFFF